MPRSKSKRPAICSSKIPVEIGRTGGLYKTINGKKYYVGPVSKCTPSQTWKLFGAKAVPERMRKVIDLSDPDEVDMLEGMVAQLKDSRRGFVGSLRDLTKYRRELRDLTKSRSGEALGEFNPKAFNFGSAGPMPKRSASAKAPARRSASARAVPIAAFRSYGHAKMVDSKGKVMVYVKRDSKAKRPTYYRRLKGKAMVRRVKPGEIVGKVDRLTKK